ncbi:hypothetical protein OC844_004349 [Tilletia horrida]|nr:hypothetical protein OC844_004349 [Tilletia horrida]
MAAGDDALSRQLGACQSPADFASLAHTLLTSCHLVVQPSPSPSSSSPSSSSSSSSSAPSQRRFILSDIEFYHFDPPIHPDPFAHAHASQVNSATWYFHAAGTGDGFKEGSYKGLDVTFGSAQSRSGILFRRITEVSSASSLDTPTVVDGPSLLCDTVLTTLGFTKVRDLVASLRSHPSGCDLSATHPQSPLRIELIPGGTPPLPLELGRIWACPRHGLSLKKTKQSGTDELRLRLEYVAKPYRFLSARPKNGPINLAYSILLELLAGHVQSTTSSQAQAAAKQVASPMPLTAHVQAVLERMDPITASKSAAVTAARNRASRTIVAFLEHIDAGRRKHPSSFAGSGMATTREVGELYGSLIEWDGQSSASKSETGGDAPSTSAPDEAQAHRSASPSVPSRTTGSETQKRKREDGDGQAEGCGPPADAASSMSTPVFSARALRAARRG